MAADEDFVKLMLEKMYKSSSRPKLGLSYQVILGPILKILLTLLWQLTYVQIFSQFNNFSDS